MRTTWRNKDMLTIDKDYQLVYMSSLRWWTLKYWLSFNNKEIKPSDIDEEQIFSYADLWYIKKTNS